MPLHIPLHIYTTYSHPYDIHIYFPIYIHMICTSIGYTFLYPDMFTFIGCVTPYSTTYLHSYDM